MVKSAMVAKVEEVAQTRELVYHLNPMEIGDSSVAWPVLLRTSTATRLPIGHPVQVTFGVEGGRLSPVSYAYDEPT